MASTPTSTTTVEALEQERAILDRVLHRLVVSDDDKLSAVLDKLLPKLVRKLNDATPLRAKVVDVLSHISKRARPNPSITLPCAELLAVCKDVSPTSFAFNFGIMFLEMGVPRLPPAEQGAVAAQIAHGISRLPRYSPSQNILLNLMLAVLEHLPLRVADAQAGQAATATTAASAARTERLAPEDSAVATDWFLDICLYPGVLTREGSAYHGLSAAGLARLTATEKEWPAALLTRRKLAVVRALKSDLFAPSAAVAPAVSAAACSTHHEVLKAAEDLLKSLSSSDRNGALRRDSAVASGLLNLVLGGGGGGSQAPGTAATAITAGSATAGGGGAATVAAASLSPSRSPASSALAVRALAWLEAECPEGTAARIPEAVRVSFQALFVAGVSGEAAAPRAPGAPHHDRANAARFQAAGARLAAFVAARCNPAMLPMVGPLLLQAVQRVLTMNAAAGAGAAGGPSGAAGDTGEAPPAGATLLMQIQRAAMLEACYEAVASLAVRRPELFSGETSVPRLLFSELSAKEPSLRVKISAALGALKGAYRAAVGTSLTPELWSLLWGAAASSEHRARLCAVEWACDLFDFSDVAARRLCMTLCDDKVTAVRSAASRGLHPQSRASTTVPADDNAATATATATASATKSSTHPKFESFVLGALRDAVPPGSSSPAPAPASLQELPPAALARALDFALECHRAHHHPKGSGGTLAVEDAEGGGEAENEDAIAVFLSLIEDTLMSAPSATDGQHSHTQMVLLHRSAAVSLRKLAAGDTGAAPGTVKKFSPVKGVAAKLASRGPWLQQWLGHESSTEIREAFAETTGAAAAFMDPNAELVSLLRALVHKLKPCTVPGAVGFSNRAVSSAHGAACAVGAILARLATAAKPTPDADAAASPSSSPSEGNPPGSGAWAALSDDALPSALSSVAAAIGHPVSLLHVAACDAIGRVGAAGPLPLHSGVAAASLDSSGGGAAVVATAAAAAAAAAATATAAAPTASVVGAAGEGRVTTVQAVFAQLWAACRLGETTDASRRAEAAAEALGRCCRGEGSMGHKGAEGGSGETASARVRKTLVVLFEMAKNQKEEELQFAVGAAVADLARSGPLRVPAGKVLEDMRASAKAASHELKEEAVLGEGAGEGGKAAADGGAVVDALDYVLYQVLYVLLEDHSPHVSGAASVYLLAVVKGCREHPVLAAYLTDVQTAFTRKLSVRSEFVQEVAGKGLAFVYQAASSDSKQGLVDSLVEALSTGRRRAAAAGTSGAAAGGGGTDGHGTVRTGSALSEAGGGAYGEMCAVANDVGRPDLIYSFLSMASHHAAWSTRRGSTFGVGAIVDNVSAEAFGEHLDRIVPRLFRYRFDPSAKTRSAMDQLWRSVVGGGSGGGDFSAREKEVIRANLSAIVSELLRALGGRKWRERQSACTGLSDVLRGKGWDDIEPHLELLWTMTDRALDDIKESVVEVAVDFAKTVSNITVRLCDPYSYVPSGGGGNSPEGDAEAAAAAAARSDAAGHGPDALREEAGEARRTIGTMMEDLRTSEAEARERGEEGGEGGPLGGLASGEGREDAADEVVRRALEARRQAEGGGEDGGGPGEDAGVGRVLGGRRNDPTVDDILRPGRAGAERTGPPPSAAARKAAAGAVAVTLPWLLRKGILSKCKASQGLAMRTLQRLVKVCEKEALMPHLAELVATLIEGLSALEPQALQYMQFHAETQMEMTQDQMERLRLSVSRAGPLQDALDQCYRHLDGAGVVEELMPRLLGLLRSGTGLATRSASAYLVLSLCERAPLEIRRAAPRLLPTLTNTALSERSSTLRRTYSSALSSVARLAQAAGVSRLASRLAQLFREADPDFDKRQRRTLALLLGDLCRRAGGQLGAAAGKAGKSRGGDDAGGAGGEGGGGFASSGWAQILPVAFVARRDPDKPVADAFEEAWQEGLTQLQLGAAGQGEASRVRTAKDAVLLMLPAILTEVWLAVSSVSRITKRQGCSGLKDLASTLGPALGEASSGRRLVRRVLSQARGRTWEGKEELLEALVSICAAGKGSAVTVEPFLWGEPGGGGGGGDLCSRGVKRNWRSEPLGGEGEEEEEEEVEAEGGEEEEEGGGGDGADEGAEAGEQARGVSAAVEGASNDASVPAKVSPCVSGGGGNGVGAAAAAAESNQLVSGLAAGSLEGSAVGNDEDSADGAEAAFLYEDKIGDLDNATPGEAGAGADSGSPAPTAVATVVAVGQDQQLTAGSRVTAEPRNGPVAESVPASLDVGDDSPVPFGDVVSLMLAQLRRKNVKFRRVAAVSLAALLDAFPECCVYDMVAPTLLDFAALDGPRPDGKEDPIMQARAVACLAAAWPRVPPSAAAPSAAAGGDKQEGSSQTKIAAITTATTATGAAAAAAMETEVAFFARREAVRNVQRAHAEGLTRALSGAVQRKVWSVRVPIYHALAAVVGRSFTVPSVGGGGGGGGSDGQGAASSPPVLTGSLLSDVVHAVELGAEDAKYSQVRAAAVSVVVAMTARKELRLALTPHKEGLVNAARTAAEDPEPRVAVEGSKATQNLSWWP